MTIAKIVERETQERLRLEAQLDMLTKQLNQTTEALSIVKQTSTVQN